MQEVFGFVKENLSGAQRRKSAASGERGAGKGAAALVPASALKRPEREALCCKIPQHYAVYVELSQVGPGSSFYSTAFRTNLRGSPVAGVSFPAPSDNVIQERTAQGNARGVLG